MGMANSHYSMLRDDQVGNRSSRDLFILLKYIINKIKYFKLLYIIFLINDALNTNYNNLIIKINILLKYNEYIYVTQKK